MPPLTATAALTTVTADPFGLAVSLAFTALYVEGVRRSLRRGVRWSVLRTLAFLVLGVGSLLVATCGALAAYRGVLFWAGAAQAAVLSAVTPVGLALGDPVGLARAALGEPVVARLDRALRTWPARVLMFPLTSSVLAVGTLVVVFFTGYFAVSLSSVAVRELLYAHLLVTGSLFVLPLLGEELLPAWCTHPVRALVAFGDGLLDAVPGILVMTWPRLLLSVPPLGRRAWGPSAAGDQRLAGGAMLGIAEAVGVPVLAAVCVAWMRADERDARTFDRLEDERAESEPASDRPWWESDPRFRRD